MQQYKTWLLSFEGRVTRTQFWLGLLLGFAIIVVATLAFFGLTMISNSQAMMFVLLIPFVILCGVAFWSQIALTTKRLHDLDKSGWMQLLYIIPLIGLAFFFYVALMPAKPGENRFGPNPKEIA